MNNNSLPRQTLFFLWLCVLFQAEVSLGGGRCCFLCLFTWTGLNNPLYNNVALYKLMSCILEPFQLFDKGTQPPATPPTPTPAATFLRRCLFVCNFDGKWQNRDDAEINFCPLDSFQGFQPGEKSVLTCFQLFCHVAISGNRTPHACALCYNRKKSKNK